MNNFPAMTEERQKQLLEWIKPRLSELETLSDDMPFGLDEDDQIFMEVLQTARKMLSGQSLSTDGWIKCSERMPEEHQSTDYVSEEVLFFTSDGEVEISFTDYGRWNCLELVTHWMPLPAPPEASNEQ